jgi:hypothetical protein
MELYRTSQSLNGRKDAEFRPVNAGFAWIAGLPGVQARQAGALP